MRVFMGVVSVFVLLVSAALGCTTTTSATDPLCNDEVPDGGNTTPDAGLACDVVWTCSSDTATYELQCKLMGANFECACLNEGVVGTTFTTQPFTCTNEGAMPAATSTPGCGWTLM